MKSSTHFHLKSKILADFQIYIGISIAFSVYKQNLT